MKRLLLVLLLVVACAGDVPPVSTSPVTTIPIGAPTDNPADSGVREVYLSDGTRCVVYGYYGGIDCDWPVEK